MSDIPLNEIEMKGDYVFHYKRIKLSDDTVTTDRDKALSRRHAEARLAKWNRNGVTFWRYELIEK